MAWDDPTSKSKLEAGPTELATISRATIDSIHFQKEADPDGWNIPIVSQWQDTLQPLWVATWDLGPVQVVSGDTVSAYNNGFNNGIAIGINIKH